MKEFEDKGIVFPELPLKSYPWKGKFTSDKEVKEYIFAKKPLCLLCGRTFKELSKHLSEQHHITQKKYNRIYNLILKEEPTDHLKAGNLNGDRYLPGASPRTLKDASITFPKPPKEGYPWDGQFTLPEEIEEYFAHVELCCLLCGRSFRSLGKHIMPSHSISIDEYKERFGLPWGRGLVGTETKQKYSNRAHFLRKTGKWCDIPPEKAALGNLAPRKPFQPYQRVQCGINGQKWFDSDYQEFLRRVETGRLPAEVAQDLDMPSCKLFIRYRAKNPDYEKQFKVILRESLPYLMQEDNEYEATLTQEIMQLHKNGHTVDEIAKIFEIKESTIQKHIESLNKAKCTHYPWSDDDYKKFLRRLENGRSLSDVTRDTDIPPMSNIWWRCKRNKEFREKYEQVWNSLPYDVQRSSHKFGKNFTEEIAYLFSHGKKTCEIAEILAVSETTVRRHLRKSKGEKRNPPKKLKRSWSVEDYEIFLQRIAQGRTPTEVAFDQDMPSMYKWRQYLRENKDYKLRFQKCWNSLPFKIQAKGRRLSENFTKEAVKLRRKRYSYKRIASQLGVKESIVYSHLKQSGLVKASNYKWTKKDYDEYLRRISNGRSPKEVGQDVDMPSHITWLRYKKANDSYNQRCEEIWDKLPFQMQVKHHKTGNRFYKELNQLNQQGLSHSEISKLLDVSRQTIRNYLKKDI